MKTIHASGIMMVVVVSIFGGGLDFFDGDPNSLPARRASEENTDDRPPHEGNKYRAPIVSRGGVVSTRSDSAAAVGIDVLDEGGNAIDAAIAMALAESVQSPYFCGIGGSGTLVYREAGGTAYSLDFEPGIPASATPDDFPTDLKFNGHRNVSIPGTIAGFHAAHARLGSGRMLWKDLIVDPDPGSVRRAEGMARNGIVVEREDTFFAIFAQLPLSVFKETRDTYLIGGVSPYPEKTILYQRDLSESLRLIADEGPSAFYRGSIARLIVDDMENASWKTDQDPIAKARYPAGTRDLGLLTMDDLANYTVRWDEPLRMNYRDTELLGAAPPAATLVAFQMLNILNGYPLGEADGAPFPGDPVGDRDWSVMSANAYHALAETEKIAWTDFTRFGGDPSFANVPIERLLNPGYGEVRRHEIAWRAGDYEHIPGQAGTCSVVVIDRNNNAVAMTWSVGGLFGSHVMPPETGILLNDQLTSGEIFNTTGDWPNNAFAPGKHIVRTHAPMIVVRDGLPLMAIGGAGASLIPMSVAQGVVNAVDFGMDIAHALDAPRVHAAFAPASCGKQNDRLAIEALTRENRTVMTRARVTMAVQDELAERWELATNNPHKLCRPAGTTYKGAPGEGFSDYFNDVASLQAVGVDPTGTIRFATFDSHATGVTAWPELRQKGAAGQGS